ncbi:hypothetical protein K440DRAFT_586597, partial [Wilcoxina mikolae CBS 423.85]
MSSTNSQIPRPKPRTFRLSLVPIDVRKEQLRESLEALLAISTQNGARNVKVLSLVPKSCKWQVGTVTFVNEPPDFAGCLPNRRLELLITIAGNEVELAVDCDFLGLTPLYCSPCATVDIIAVCGVGGHAFGSWRSQSSTHKMWLRDFLPKDIPKIRTLTFGYDAALKDSTSTSSIVDYARQLLLAIHNVRADGEGENRRPIIFVAHSMGGLLVKQALAAAAQGSSDDDREIFQSCVGVFLFGVPNRGLNAINLDTLVRGQNNAQLIANLREGSQLLRHIH